MTSSCGRRAAGGARLSQPRHCRWRQRSHMPRLVRHQGLRVDRLCLWTGQAWRRQPCHQQRRCCRRRPPPPPPLPPLVPVGPPAEAPGTARTASATIRRSQAPSTGRWGQRCPLGLGHKRQGRRQPRALPGCCRACSALPLPPRAYPVAAPAAPAAAAAAAAAADGIATAGAAAWEARGACSPASPLSRLACSGNGGGRVHRRHVRSARDQVPLIGRGWGAAAGGCGRLGASRVHPVLRGGVVRAVSEACELWGW